MSLLSFFNRKPSTEGLIKKYSSRIADKRAYPADREESIRAISEIKSSEAAEGLLMRFTYKIDPSITDQEEKELAYQGIINMGEIAVPAVAAFMQTADTIAWPVRILTAILPKERVTEELLQTLQDMNIEYERDPQRKIQLIAELEQHLHADILTGVIRFLEDASEPVRFHAVGAFANQEAAIGQWNILWDRLLIEESARVRARILDMCMARSMKIPATLRDQIKSRLPRGYEIDSKNEVQRQS